MPCGAQSAPGLTVTATTDPADVTCGLCATSAECREAASCRSCGPGGIGLCAGCQDAEAAELAYMEEHHPVALATVGAPPRLLITALGPHCGAEGCGGQDCDCRDDCGHPMCQMAASVDEPAPPADPFASSLDGDGETAMEAFNAAHDAEDARVDAEQAQAGAE